MRIIQMSAFVDLGYDIEFDGPNVFDSLRKINVGFFPSSIAHEYSIIIHARINYKNSDLFTGTVSRRVARVGENTENPDLSMQIDPETLTKGRTILKELIPCPSGLSGRRWGYGGDRRGRAAAGGLSWLWLGGKTSAAGSNHHFILHVGLRLYTHDRCLNKINCLRFCSASLLSCFLDYFHFLSSHGTF